MHFGLFYFPPVATVSPVFYLDVHSNWPTFRGRFIMSVQLLEKSPSLTKPNMLSHILRMGPHSLSHIGELQPSHLIGHRGVPAAPVIPQCTGWML